MKYASLKTRRRVILLIPFLFVVLDIIAILISYYTTNYVLEEVLGIIILILYPLIPIITALLFLSYWRCPHCEKFLIHWLPMLFIGWFWLLLHTPEECSHCAKKLDFNAKKKKEKKLPEWAKQLENKKSHDENEYFRH